MKIMFAENDLHRKSCCFKQYLNDILNEILRGKETEGIVSFPPAGCLPEYLNF